MTFETALVYAKQGKKIRRAIFDEGVCFTIKDETLINWEHLVAYHEVWSPNGRDICAEDWEVIDEH